MRVPLLFRRLLSAARLVAFLALALGLGAVVGARAETKLGHCMMGEFEEVIAAHSLTELPALAENAGATRVEHEALDARQVPPLVEKLSFGPGSATPPPAEGGNPFLVFRIKGRNGRSHVGVLHAGESYFSPGGTGLVVTHRTLLDFLNRSFAGRFEVIGAGELWCRNGQIYRVTNRSSTFPGGAPALAGSVVALRDSGLTIGPKVEVEDWAIKVQHEPGSLRLADGHLERAARFAAEAKYRGTAMLAEFERIDAQLAREFPDPNHYGHFSIEALDGAIPELRKRHPGDFQTLYAGSFFHNLNESPIFAATTWGPESAIKLPALMSFVQEAIAIARAQAAARH